MAKTIGARKNEGNPRVLLTILVILALIIVGGVLVWLLSGKGVLFSPTNTIVSLMNDVKSNPTSYTIVVDDSAVSDVIVQASNFAGAFGVQDSKKRSEIFSDTKLIYININSELIFDSKVVYFLAKNSLIISAKDAVQLSNIVDKVVGVASGMNLVDFGNAGVSFVGGVASVLTCDGRTAYESCSDTKPGYCEVMDLDGNASMVSKSNICGMPVEDPIIQSRVISENMQVGQTYNVEVKVTIIEDGLKTLGVGEKVPSAFDVVSTDPDPLPYSKTANGTTLAWTKTNPVKGNTYTYKYSVKPISAGSYDFAGKREVIRSDDSSFVISISDPRTKNNVVVSEVAGGGGGQCTEDWQCGEWGGCVSGMQTRNCNDRNNCGTISNRPPLTQICTPTPICVDSDGGININVSGSIIYNGLSYADMCSPVMKKITEYFCIGDAMQSTEFDCAVCSGDGKACLQQFATPVGCTPVCNENEECVIPLGQTTGTCVPKAVPITLYDVLSNMSSNQNHGYKGVVGRNALTIDSIGMIDVAGKFRITSTKVDDQYNLVNIQDNLVIVGGPCVNSLAGELNTKGKFEYGCSNWPGGGDFVVAKFVENAFGTGKDVIFIAGTKGEDTREMAKLVKQYNEADKNAKFKAGKIICKASDSTKQTKPRFCQELGLSDDSSTL